MAICRIRQIANALIRGMHNPQKAHVTYNLSWIDIWNRFTKHMYAVQIINQLTSANSFLKWKFTHTAFPNERLH